MSIIKFDCHTHTYASGHAYSTLEENIRAAREYGLEGLAVTDHGPAMLGGPHEIHFMNLKALPQMLNGMRLLRGAEVNILDYSGKMDLSLALLKKLDLCIASYHEFCIKPASETEHTDGWLSVIANPYVDVLGHPGRGRFKFDIDRVVMACKEHHKAIEVNNMTLAAADDKHLCREIVAACIKYQVPIMVNSDAHFSGTIGRVHRCKKLLAAMEFPDELILNKTWPTLQEFLRANGRNV